MKKAIYFPALLIILILMTDNKLLSYEWEWGLMTGIMHSQADISRDLPGINMAAIDEFSIGSFMSFYIIRDAFGIQPEIHYSIKGFNALESDLGVKISSKYKISYLEVPLLISYQFPLNGRIKSGIILGPYFGFAQKVNEVQAVGTETEKRKLDDNLKKTDVGLVIGGNFRYQLGSISILFDTRYTLGLVNISKNIMDVAYDFTENDSIKNRGLTFSLGIAYHFFKRKNQ
jgi:hypothetical protein